MTLHRAHPHLHGSLMRGSSMHGFSMLEVLIAVLVFSLGMIGLAGLLIFAISSNHVAYLRTQATFLAHNMADRMGANPSGIWSGAYNVTAIDPPGTAVPTCASGCAPAAVAARDIAAWSEQVNTFLPNAKGTITCNTTGIAQPPITSQYGLRPPYGGQCTMTLGWNEAHSVTGQQQLHYFQWVFQP